MTWHMTQSWKSRLKGKNCVILLEVDARKSFNKIYLSISSFTWSLVFISTFQPFKIL